MKTCVNVIMNAVVAAFLVSSCDAVKVEDGRDVRADAVRLEEVAEILSLLPLETAQLNEVYEAVTSSSGNGYDEEYTMKDLFQRPGAGVGDIDVKSIERLDRRLSLFYAECEILFFGKGSGRVSDCIDGVRCTDILAVFGRMGWRDDAGHHIRP